MRHIALVHALLISLASTARSQERADFVGSVTDSARRPISGAEISLPALSKSTVTNDSGRFRLGEIGPGRHEVIVRYLGYSPHVDHVAFAGNRTIERDIVLRRVTTLDTVAVRASVVIPSFEEHRALGIGHFITRAELEKQEGRRVSEIISQVPGVRIRHGYNSRAWLYSSRRSQTSINPRGTGRDQLDGLDVRNGAQPGLCYAQVYLDNSIVYRGRPEEPLFDLNTLAPSQIEAIEYYTGPARTPLRYSRLNSVCGVLVVHTRKTPF